MKFVDEAEIRVEAGDGGAGTVSFAARNMFLMAARMAAMVVMVVAFT